MTNNQITTLINTMQNRKNNTDKAIKDLYEIMAWLSSQMDCSTITNPSVNIHARLSWFANGMLVKERDNDDEYPSIYRIECRHGKVGLYMHGVGDYVELRDDPTWIDYINLKEAYDSLIALIDKLAKISDRQEITAAIHHIAEVCKSSAK